MFEFLVRDYAISIGLIIFVASIFRLFPDARRRIWYEPSTGYRLLARGIVLLGLLSVVWITVFDNWRKIIGVLTGWVQDEQSQAVSDPFLAGTTSDLVRTVSWALFLGAVVGGAYLFARYSRGIIEPIILGPISLALFYVLNTFRLRIDLDAVRIAYGSIEGPLEVLSTMVWIAGLLVTFALLITAMYLMMWSPLALIFSIVYRATFGKELPGDAPILRRIRERQSSSL